MPSKKRRRSARSSTTPATDTPAEAEAPSSKPAPTDGAVGKVLGRCKLLERIGRGNTAIVYRAHYEPLDQEVAVKILLPSISSNETLVERFLTEARTIAMIDNENVVKIYDVGEDGGNYYMVMELLEGEEILDLIRREGQVDFTDSLRLVRQAAQGLAAAHAKGLIHRDVKPQNLFLREDGTIKVVDFGLAADVDGTTERVGTPHYMAPEVCKTGKAELSSDVYALGVCLHHLLTGQPPYAGQKLQQILRSHMNGAPLRPEAKRPTLPKEICELVRTLTKADPLARPSAAEVVTMLDAIGGKALKDKNTLKRGRGASSRGRSGSKNMLVPVLAGLAALGVLAFALSSGNSDNAKGNSNNNGTTTASTDGTAKNEGPTDAEMLAAERARRKSEADAAKTKAEADAKEAFARAEDEVRKMWKTRDDTPAVIKRYRFMRDRYKGTESAKKAKQRVKDIKDGKVHPHPDRTFASEDEVKSTLELWTTSKAQLIETVAKHDYAGAGLLIPKTVNDASGNLAQEIEFWRRHVTRLVAFKGLLVKGLTKKAKAESLTFSLGDEDATLKNIAANEVRVSVNGEEKKVAWSAVPAAEWDKLSTHAVDSTSIDHAMMRLAFSFAHNLEDPFWDRTLDVNSSADKAKFADDVAGYSKRFEER